MGLHSPGVIDLGDHLAPCQLVDVSTTGIAIVTPAEAPLRAVRVRFQLGGKDAAWTELEGMVVRQRKWEGEGNHRQQNLWALRLQPMDLGTRTRLRGYVSGQLRG